MPQNIKASASATTNISVSRPSAADIEAERIYREEAEREARELGSDESEEEFGDLDEGLALPTAYDWSDRYRPRKPRFFNRVHTGFEWSKYNQTHYDVDNPPPKVVQGYKFNIFYPDLMLVLPFLTSAVFVGELIQATVTNQKPQHTTSRKSQTIPKLKW